MQELRIISKKQHKRASKKKTKNDMKNMHADTDDDYFIVYSANSIFEEKSIEAAAIDGKIDKLDVYISMYDNLDLSNTIESKKDTINNDEQKPFQELDLENLDIDKLKLNLTK